MKSCLIYSIVCLYILCRFYSLTCSNVYAPNSPSLVSGFIAYTHFRLITCHGPVPSWTINYFSGPDMEVWKIILDNSYGFMERKFFSDPSWNPEFTSWKILMLILQIVFISKHKMRVNSLAFCFLGNQVNDFSHIHIFSVLSVMF